MASLFQFIIASIWGAALTIHTRRLFRLACVEQLRRWEELRFRSSLQRIWWWLGQDEFWRDVRVDCMRCLQLTLMVFLVAWGISI